MNVMAVAMNERQYKDWNEEGKNNNKDKDMTEGDGPKFCYAPRRLNRPTIEPYSTEYTLLSRSNPLRHRMFC